MSKETLLEWDFELLMEHSLWKWKKKRLRGAKQYQKNDNQNNILYTQDVNSINYIGK